MSDSLTSVTSPSIDLPPLAHSQRNQQGPQPYAEHVKHVVRRARANAEAVARFTDSGARFVDSVVAAATVHDLGKLDTQNQRVLRDGGARRLPLNHVDAGVAALSSSDPEAMLTVRAHHRGLSDLTNTFFSLHLRDPDLRDHTDAHIDSYLTQHVESVGETPPQGHLSLFPTPAGLSRRLALSCLVDADHEDTAQAWGAPLAPTPPDTRWEERLSALDSYVENLKREAGPSPRTDIRTRIFEACRVAPTEPPIRSCDSPVGTGKTTAVMAYLLSVAAEKRLRHIFVVLPFTNIIDQTVETLRQALVLPGEDPEAVVAAHHHEVAFSSHGVRHLTTLWRAPIVVTTAVQFFETLSSSRTSRLRKLHELPGSGVFIDEAHTAIPTSFWRVTWRWLSELAHGWGAHFVLGSGSLIKYWEIPEIVPDGMDVPDLVPEDVREAALALEAERVTLLGSTPNPTLEDLIDTVLAATGPRIVVMNTVSTAAEVAHRALARGADVMHLSTALAPRDRRQIVKAILARLDGSERDWILVATSCVEAGLQFSFATGFRESASATSLLQLSGRVNRHSETLRALVHDVRVATTADGYTSNPGLRVSREVLASMFSDECLDPAQPAASATESIVREIQVQDVSAAARKLEKLETNAEYRRLSNAYSVIGDETRLVVVDTELAERLERDPGSVDWKALQSASVRIRPRRVEQLNLRVLIEDGDGSVYAWDRAYDAEFLGYMAAVV